MNEKRFNSLIHYLIFLLVGVLIIQGFISTFFFRQLENDGARWMMVLINNQFFVRDPPQHRYFGFIIQVFPLLYSFFSKNIFVMTWLFCFSYFVFPFAGLGGLLLINRTDNFIFLLFSILGLCIAPQWSFSVSGVNEAIIIGLFLFLLATDQRKSSLLGFFVFSLFSIFTYELVFVFHLLIIGISFFENRVDKRKSMISLISALVIFLNLIFILIPHKAHQYFTGTFGEVFYSWAFYNVILLFVYFMLQKKCRGLCNKIFIFLIVIFAWLEFSSFPVQDYINRIWAIPAAALLLLWYWWRSKNADNIFGTDHKMIIILLVLLNVMTDGRSVYQSFRFMRTLESFMNNSQDRCISLDEKEVAKLRAFHSGDMMFLPLYSLLRNHSYKIEKLVFDRSRLILPETCNNSANRFIIAPQMSFTNQGQLDFSLLINGHQAAF